MINQFIKYIIKSKWKFSKPEYKPLLLVDGQFDPLKYYFNKSHYNILYRRGEEINFVVLFKCLIELDFKFKNYILNYIKIAKPKLLITSIHNYVGFYKLSKLTGVKTMFIQSGIVTKWGDLFGNKKIIDKRNKKIFKVDYMLVFNSSYGREFSKFISGKYFVIGSFKNNLIKNKYKKKKEILFLSTYKSSEHSSELINGIPSYKFTQNDRKLLLRIIELCKKNNLKMNVLGKQVSPEESLMEKKYYKKIFENELKFIKNFPGRETYKIIRRFKYVLNIDSTLGIENFSSGGRTGFIFVRPYESIIKSRAFGYLEKLGRKGPFWTSFNNTKEISRIFNFVTKTKDKNWKQVNKFYLDSVMPNDKNNKTFISILKNEIGLK